MRGRAVAGGLGLLLLAEPAFAASAGPGSPVVPPVYLFGIPVDFFLFGLTLIGVAILRHRTLGRWLRHGWYVAVSYAGDFFVMLAIIGWNPDAPHKKRVELPTSHVFITTGDVT
jgi:hypothetical protein